MAFLKDFEANLVSQTNRSLPTKEEDVSTHAYELIKIVGSKPSRAANCTSIVSISRRRSEGEFNTPPPPLFCDITHQSFVGKKLKNLNFSASCIYRIYTLISYYVRGLQYMPPRVLALWGQNHAGATTVCFSFFVCTSMLLNINLKAIKYCTVFSI